MPVKIKPLPTTLSTKAPPPALPAEPVELKASKLQVFDIPDELLLDHSDNPNEQDDATFDTLVEKIRQDGFDEPITVVPSVAQPGKYLIFSGHHRRKAGKLAGMAEFPAVIKEGWDEDKVAIELVSRNVLSGKPNPEKFTALFNKLRKKGYDLELLRAQMSLRDDKEFKALYKQIENALPAPQRAKLASAGERANSVDGMSSVLNEIFTEHGSDLEHGFLIFSFGKQTHHKIECDKDLHIMMEKLEQRCRDEDKDIRSAFKSLLRDTDAIPLGQPGVKLVAIQRTAPKPATPQPAVKPLTRIRPSPA